MCIDKMRLLASSNGYKKLGSWSRMVCRQYNNRVCTSYIKVNYIKMFTYVHNIIVMHYSLPDP